MYLSVPDATHLAEKIRRALPQPKSKVVVCPSFPALLPVGAVLKKSRYDLGAQDLSIEIKGSQTGQVCPKDLKDLGCKYVIVGHSERRAIGESDLQIKKKFTNALAHKLIPILCVGETLEEKKSGQAKSIVRNQLTVVLKNLQATSYKLKAIHVAYEPVWAIGTGCAANPEDACEMHAFIKETVTKLVGHDIIIRILYGGSVTAENAQNYLKEKGVDGLLVGGASTKLTFVDILKTA